MCSNNSMVSMQAVVISGVLESGPAGACRLEGILDSEDQNHHEGLSQRRDVCCSRICDQGGIHMASMTGVLKEDEKRDVFYFGCANGAK